MFNQKLLKTFLVASWIMVIYAATPYAEDGTRWLAGVVLGMSYALCGLVFGSTDNEAMKIIRGLQADIQSDRSISKDLFLAQARKAEDTINDCKIATDRVSKAIAELRSLDSRRFE